MLGTVPTASPTHTATPSPSQDAPPSAPKAPPSRKPTLMLGTAEPSPPPPLPQASASSIASAPLQSVSAIGATSTSSPETSTSSTHEDGAFAASLLSAIAAPSSAIAAADPSASSSSHSAPHAAELLETAFGSPEEEQDLEDDEPTTVRSSTAPIAATQRMPDAIPPPLPITPAAPREQRPVIAAPNAEPPRERSAPLRVEASIAPDRRGRGGLVAAIVVGGALACGAAAVAWYALPGAPAPDAPEHARAPIRAEARAIETAPERLEPLAAPPETQLESPPVEAPEVVPIAEPEAPIEAPEAEPVARAPVVRQPPRSERAHASPPPELSEAELRSRLAQNPADDDSRLALAAMLSTRGDDHEAQQLLVESEGSPADDATVRLRRIELLARLGRASEAQSEFDALPEDARNTAQARMSAARIALAAGRPEDAMRELAPLAEAPNASAPLLALYAQASLAAGRVGAASNAYAASMERDAMLPEALLGRAEMAVRSRRPDAALRLLAQLDRALEANPRPAAFATRAEFLRGRAQIMSDLDDDARRTLTRVVEREGAPHDAYFFLAEAHTGHDYRAARAAYHRYLELEPNGRYAQRARRALGITEE